MMRLVLVSLLLCLAQTVYPQVDTSGARQTDTSSVEQTDTSTADTPAAARPGVTTTPETETPETETPEAETQSAPGLDSPRVAQPDPPQAAQPVPQPAARRSYRPRPKPLYINTDTVLHGPAPTDTSRNAVNGFLRNFYSDYNTDRRLLKIPATRSETHAVPDLDFQLREIRPAWQLLILAVLCILTAVLSRFFRKDLRDMLEGFVSNRLVNQTTREPGMLNTPMAFMLLILGSLSLGALLYFIIPADTLSLPYRGPELFLFFSGLILLAYLARILLLKITGFIFGLREFVNSYLYILYTATGTICIPILIVLFVRLLAPPQLADLSIPALQLIFLLFFVYQYTRGVWYLVYTFQFPKIYLILYLCAFEICPLLILGMGLFNS